MPKKMDYDSQAILVLAPDMTDDAQDLQDKREAAGDTKNAFKSSIPKSRIFNGPQITPLPVEYRQPTSRLYILGHGDPDFAFLQSAQSGGTTWSPEQLYDLLKTWMTTPGCVPSRVKRISLLMCYGGGNRGAAPVAGSARNQSAFEVKPENSFAHAFARIAGTLAADVTARTAEMQGTRLSRRGTFVTTQQEVDGRHHGEGDKFIFTTVAGSTPTKPQNPAFRSAR